MLYLFFFFFEVDVYYRSKTISVCFLFFEMTQRDTKIRQKEGTAKERTRLHIFIKFIQKKIKNWIEI